MIIVESFLTAESIELVQFPSNFFYFASFGIRSEGEEGGAGLGRFIAFATLFCFLRFVV